MNRFPSLLTILGSIALFLLPHSIYTHTYAQGNTGKLVFSAGFGNITVINSDGTGQTFLTNSSRGDRHPAWSPDGSKIAFESNRIGQSNIFLMNSDGTNIVALTNAQTPFFNSGPTWSPDGKKIAFYSNRGGERRSEIWVMNQDGTGLTRLTTNVQLGIDGSGPYGWDREPVWSPDGSKITFSSARESLSTSDIYVMNSDGSNQVKLTETIAEDTNPTWSPDSRKLAFYSLGGGRIGIYIIDLSTRSLTSVTPDGRQPSWSPDGSKLVFTGLDPDNHYNDALYVINIDGSNKIKLTNNPFGCWDANWAPASSPPIPIYKISGHVLDADGKPVTAATLNLTDAITKRTVQTDSLGFYSFTGLATDTYTLAISKPGFGFTPPSRDFLNLAKDQTADFTSYITFSISGQVKNLGGNGVSIILSGSKSASTQTAFGGQYSFDGLPAGGNYTVTPTSLYFTSTPISRSFNSLSANQNADFDVNRTLYSISGKVTRLGKGFGGVTVTLRYVTNKEVITTTDSNGNYLFTDVPAAGSYTVDPSKPNYRFSSAGWGSLDGNKVADFVAMSTNNLLFTDGVYRLGENRCFVKVIVARGGNATGVGPITVDYATSNGTALAGTDYTHVSGTLYFAEGEYSKTISIPILDDTVVEGDENFSISLSNPTGEVDIASPSTAVITIADNDPAGTPVLLTQENSDLAVALNSQNSLAGPFRLFEPRNFTVDKRTRVSLFLSNAELGACEGSSIITVDAEDLQQNRYSLPVEFAATLTGAPIFAQVVVRLPDGLPVGDLLLTARLRGIASNRARLVIYQ